MFHSFLFVLLRKVAFNTPDILKNPEPCITQWEGNSEDFTCRRKYLKAFNCVPESGKKSESHEK